MSSNVRQHTFKYMHPTKIQISLRIRTVWLDSSLGAFRKAKDGKFPDADNEDSDQIAMIRKLIWVFVGRTWQTVHFLTLRFL